MLLHFYLISSNVTNNGINYLLVIPKSYSSFSAYSNYLPNNPTTTNKLY